VALADGLIQINAGAVTPTSIRRPDTNFRVQFHQHATQYQNGVDMHFDWGASQFLTEQVQGGYSRSIGAFRLAAAARATA
jgi:hypothetical protein